jgi:hypothetical protein
MIRPRQLPVTLARFAERQPLIEEAYVLDSGFDEDEYNYGIRLVPGYHFAGYHTTMKNFRTVREALGCIYMIEACSDECQH